MNCLGANDHPFIVPLGRGPGPCEPSQSGGRPGHSTLSAPVPPTVGTDIFVQPPRPSPQLRYTPGAQVHSEHRLLHSPVGSHVSLPSDVHPSQRNNDENVFGAPHGSNKSTHNYVNGSLNESTNNIIYPSSLPLPSIEPSQLEHLPYSNGSTLRKRRHDELRVDNGEQRFKKRPSRLQPTQPFTSSSSCILLAQPTWLPTKDNTPNLLEHLRRHLPAGCAEVRATVDAAFDSRSGRFTVSQSSSIGGRTTEIIADILQQCLTKCRHSRSDEAAVLRFLQDICVMSDQLPLCYWLEGVTRGRRRVGGGAEASVFVGQYQGETVAVREPNVPDSDDWKSSCGRRLLKEIRRELVGHWQLRHENVLPLMGVYQETPEDPPSMVLPYMSHGSAQKFLKVYGDDADSFLHVIRGVASGLVYLHSRTPPVIHGDLHGTNILIDLWGNAYISDFGCSRIRHEISRTLTSVRTGGRSRFLAPEISRADVPRPTQQSDIYSFAMTIYALGTGSAPLDHLGERAATRAAEGGERPRLPQALGGLDLEGTHKLFQWLVCMWHQSPDDRVSARKVEWCIKDLQVDRMIFSYRGAPNESYRNALSGISRAFESYDLTTGVALFQSVSAVDQCLLVREILSRAHIPEGEEEDRYDARLRLTHLTEFFARLSEVCSGEIFVHGFVSWAPNTPVRLSSSICRSLARLLFATKLPRSQVVECCRRVQKSVQRDMLDEWDKLKLEDFEARVGLS